MNDIVQHSKRKNYTELLEKFQLVLKESMPHLKEAKICEKVLRCLNIWSERGVFDEKYITDLTAIVDPSKNKAADQDILDTFQVSSVTHVFQTLFLCAPFLFKKGKWSPFLKLSPTLRQIPRDVTNISED